MDVLNLLWMVLKDIFYNWDNILVVLLLIAMLPFMFRALIGLILLYIDFVFGSGDHDEG